MKRTIIFSILFLFCISSALALQITMSEPSGSVAIISISGAENIYAYEVMFNYTNSVPTINQTYFLARSGSGEHGWYNDVRDDGLTNETANLINGDSIYGDAYGGSANPMTRAVYGSRLDNQRIGINGSGELFRINHNGKITLYSAIIIDNAGNEINLDLRSSDSGDGSGSGGDDLTGSEGFENNQTKSQNQTKNGNESIKDEPLVNKITIKWMIVIIVIVIIVIVIIVTVIIVIGALIVFGRNRSEHSNTRDFS